MSEEQIKLIEEQLKSLPKVEFAKPISAFDSIDLNQLMTSIKRLKCIPNSTLLIEENNALAFQVEKLKKQNEFLMARDNKCQVLEQVIDKVIKYIENGLENIVYEVKDNCDYLPIDFYEILDILKEVK